jgi:hypothetical protein
MHRVVWDAKLIIIHRVAWEVLNNVNVLMNDNRR